jgi:hypothetical protein
MNQCRAYQVSDQMMCPCGRQWDVNDPNPPQCNGVVVMHPRLAGKTTARNNYLEFLKRKGILK